MILENRDYSLDTYSDPAAALLKFKPNYYDLLLLDHRMPNLNGLECNEPFSVHLPEDTTKADFSKCEDKDTTYHNLEHTIQCQNCEHRNTIYYCIDSHPMLMTED